MNTITLDNNTYQEVVHYAKMNNITVSDAIKSALDMLIAQCKTKATPKCQDEEYRISPKVKALETGIDYSKNLSADYKQEVIESLSQKYL